MQRSDPTRAVELSNVSIEANANAPMPSIRQQNPTSDPTLPAKAKVPPYRERLRKRPRALTFSVDQDDVTCLGKRHSPQQQHRHAVWLSKPYLFNLLPLDVQEKLVDYIEPQTAKRLVRLSLFPQALDLKVATNEAVLAVLQGDLLKTKTLVEEKPTLLTRQGQGIDYSGRHFAGITPFQAALCAWDDEMCEMLKQYMQPEEIERQYADLFPQGHAAHCAAQKPFDFSALADVITHSPEEDIGAALNKQQNNTSLCQTLNEFRVDFTSLSQHEILFNPQHFIKACEIYNERFDDWNWDQRNLFWRQVIGYVQRFLPANLAQDVAQGLYCRVDKNEPARRSFNFWNNIGAFFPLDFNTHSGLGFDYAAQGGCMLRRTFRANDRAPGGAGGDFFTILCQKKAGRLSTANFSCTELPRVVYSPGV